MYQLINEITFFAIILGTLLSFFIGGISKNINTFLFILLALVASIGVCILNIIIVLILHKLCHEELNICLDTKHNNVWNGVLFPALCTPVYFITMIVARVLK